MNIKNKLNLSSLNFKTLKYLILFSGSLLGLLWVVQIFFYKIFYEKYQVSYMNNLVSIISKYEEEEIFTELNELTLDNNICLEYIDSRGNTYFYNDKLSSCALGRNKSIEKAIISMKQEEGSTKSLKLLNPLNNQISLLYKVKVGTGYVFLFTSLEDVGTTTSTLKSQMLYITLLAILLSFIIAAYLSKVIARPIVEMTKKAEEMSKGNYDVSFTPCGIKELDELSSTLNTMEKEFAKTDEYRRDLMANVSHDLKTPLTMIRAYAEMVRDISYKKKEKREEHLNIIISETDRLNILVNDILELSKLQARVGTLELEDLDLVALIQEVVHHYEIMQETENYHLMIESPEKVMIKADHKKLSQVLYNLINNAINYTGDDLTVKILVEDLSSKYRISIQDSGKGIDEKDIPNIWTKYYKNEKKHKRNVVGTGLGLSIVKGALEEHHYSYGVESKKDQGTKFYFEIPK